ncbi:hypothetical protein DRO61_05545 [Candidatus Bathyarchaeota archaeon]|nr:MAG: hypothetical protein DRO61_05545 [Candidatus Bathyarchaeota archaeon]
MNFSEHDFIAPDEILAEVVMNTGEKRLETVSKGFIYSQMNKCLEELSYHTFFDVQSKVFTFPSSQILDIPARVFNVREIYGYSGDSCTTSNSTNIYWKRNFYINGNGAVARSKTDNWNDPFYGGSGIDKRYRAFVPRDVYTDAVGRAASQLYYYGYEKGQLHFSNECKKFSNLLIKFNGIWSVDPSKPSIPRYFRQVVTDWCSERVLRAKKAEDINKWRLLWSDYAGALDRNGFNGSWYQAESIVKRMGTKEREDLNEYLSRLNY